MYLTEERSVANSTGSPSCEAILKDCHLKNPSPPNTIFFLEPSCVGAATCNPSGATGAINRIWPFPGPVAYQPRLGKDVKPLHTLLVNMA